MAALANVYTGAAVIVIHKYIHTHWILWDIGYCVLEWLRRAMPRLSGSVGVVLPSRGRVRCEDVRCGRLPLIQTARCRRGTQQHGLMTWCVIVSALDIETHTHTHTR